MTRNCWPDPQTEQGRRDQESNNAKTEPKVQADDAAGPAAQSHGKQQGLQNIGHQRAFLFPACSRPPARRGKPAQEQKPNAKSPTITAQKSRLWPRKTGAQSPCVATIPEHNGSGQHDLHSSRHFCHPRSSHSDGVLGARAVSCGPVASAARIGTSTVKSSPS